MVCGSLAAFFVGYSVETGGECRLSVLVLQVGGGAYDAMKKLKVVSTHLCIMVGVQVSAEGEEGIIIIILYM